MSAVTEPSNRSEAASTKREETEYNGIFKPLASILATVAAILKPVYEPGPFATMILSISVFLDLLFLRLY